MKILVMSDSHTDVDTMEEIAKRENPGLLLHLGDHERDARALASRCPDLDIRMVSGNTDFAPAAPNELLFEIDGVRVFMTHGHLYGVKRGLQRLRLKGRSVGADLVLFGHTHLPFLDQAPGFWLLNPGSVGKKAHGSVGASFALVETSAGGFDCRIIDA